MTFKEYCRLDRINWSRLKDLHDKSGGSPLLFQSREKSPRPDTPTFVVGRAMHTASFEPEKFDKRYITLQGTVPANWQEIWDAHCSGDFAEKYALCYGPKVRNGHKWANFLSNHGSDPRPILLEKELDRAIELGETTEGKEILSPIQLDKALAMAAAVRSNPKVMEILEGSQYEKTIEWVDPETGIKCKGRPDVVRLDGIADLKKTAYGIGPVKHGFQYQGNILLYHGQQTFYHDGSIISGIIPESSNLPKFIAVTDISGQPHDAGVFPMTTAAVQAGRNLYRGLLSVLQRCMDSGIWPGACPDERDFDVSDWAAGAEDIDADGLDWSD